LRCPLFQMARRERGLFPSRAPNGHMRRRAACQVLSSRMLYGLPGENKTAGSVSVGSEARIPLLTAAAALSRSEAAATVDSRAHFAKRIRPARRVRAGP
jgi:hypothetical protein